MIAPVNGTKPDPESESRITIASEFLAKLTEYADHRRYGAVTATAYFENGKIVHGETVEKRSLAMR